MEEQIKKTLEDLRSMLQRDGGDLELVGIEGKVVTLRLRGACGTCPHAQMTLKNVVEAILREQADSEITVVREDAAQEEQAFL